jgi:hypothetical protein
VRATVELGERRVRILQRRQAAEASGRRWSRPGERYRPSSAGGAAPQRRLQRATLRLTDDLGNPSDSAAAVKLFSSTTRRKMATRFRSTADGDVRAMGRSLV